MKNEDMLPVILFVLMYIMVFYISFKTMYSKGNYVLEPIIPVAKWSVKNS